MITAIVDEQIWHATHEVTFGPIRLSTRATFVRLPDGSVWVHSPVPLDELATTMLQRLGPVRYVVAPNKTHHMFFAEFVHAHREAVGFLAPGLSSKKPGLSQFPTINHESHELWAGSLDAVFVEGLPVLNETVWLHRETRTLILTDLLFSFAPRDFGATQLVARLLGVYDQLAMSRTMKMMISDRFAFKRSIDRILAWPIDRVVVAHDQIIEDNAHHRLERAFRFLD